MFKAGFLGSVIGFIYVMGLTLLSPFCTLCFTPLLGVGVGYLAGKFDEPGRTEASLSRGGVAGGITAIGVVIGQILATLVNGVLVTNLENLPGFIEELGLPPSLITESEQYWQGTLLTSSFCSVLNLLLIVGLGAVGGMLWFQRQGEATRVST